MRAALKTLRTFNQKVARLETTALAKRLDAGDIEVTSRMSELSSFTPGTDGTYNLVGRLVSELEAFDQEQIEAFVLTYRMFTQKNERISVRSLAKIYASDWMPAEAAERFAEARNEINSFLDSPTLLLIGDQSITTKHLVDTIIYGHLAHTDPAKEAEFESWVLDGGLTGFVWAEFLSALRRMMHYVRYLRDLNVAVIRNCAA